LPENCTENSDGAFRYFLEMAAGSGIFRDGKDAFVNRVNTLSH
jgi:hypothetical protein